MVLALSSCAYRVDKSSELNQPTEASALKGNYGFAQLNALILTPRCLGCHSSKTPNLTSYAAVKTVIAQITKAVLVDRNMPPSGMSSADRGVLQKWILDGAPEVVSNPSPEPPSQPAPLPSGRPILWSAFKAQVFTNKCISCHFTGNKEGISDYSDINIARSTMGTMIYLTLVTKQMPPPPTKLTLEESDIFARWVIDGMKDDNGASAPPPPAN